MLKDILLTVLRKCLFCNGWDGFKDIMWKTIGIKNFFQESFCAIPIKFYCKFFAGGVVKFLSDHCKLKHLSSLLRFDHCAR
jgi:hypothetical protein